MYFVMTANFLKWLIHRFTIVHTEETSSTAAHTNTAQRTQHPPNLCQHPFSNTHAETDDDNFGFSSDMCTIALVFVSSENCKGMGARK